MWLTEEKKGKQQTLQYYILKSTSRKHQFKNWKTTSSVFFGIMQPLSADILWQILNKFISSEMEMMEGVAQVKFV